MKILTFEMNGFEEFCKYYLEMDHMLFNHNLCITHFYACSFKKIENIQLLYTF